MKYLVVALSLAFLTGYLSLSLETVWFRVVGFAKGGRPETFGVVLSAFLFGIATGSYIAGRWALKQVNVLKVTANLLVVAALLTMLSIPIVAFTFTKSPDAGMALSCTAIALVAAAFGAIFPLICHDAVRSDAAVGRRMSYIYMANIVGSTLSPLFTGLYLFDHFKLSQIVVGLTILSVVAAIVLYSFAEKSVGKRFVIIATLIALCFTAASSSDMLYEDIYAKLQHKKMWTSIGPFETVHENRSGVITIDAKQDGKDSIYGGGMYDGQFNIDPVHNGNGIRRAYYVAALHRNPVEVLEIGLASGSWARVLDLYAPIRSLDIVEINPGYQEVIRSYPEQNAVLTSKKVRIHFDDGRRWLTRNPARRFDFILMNTTWHFRSNITNLLSVEFLALVKQHLKPGGVLYYNTTFSDDIVYTASNLFRYVVRYRNFIGVSDAPFDMTHDEVGANLDKFVNNGEAIFQQTAEHVAVKHELVSLPRTNVAPEILRRKDLVQISDNNMATEFKRKRIVGGVSWGNIFQKSKGH